jgi:hypothetical protein
MKSTTINRKAETLINSGRIRARLAELQQKHPRRNDVTVDTITLELNENRQHASTSARSAQRMAGSLGKAKLHGLIVEKSEHTGPGPGRAMAVNKRRARKPIIIDSPDSSASSVNAFTRPAVAASPVRALRTRSAIGVIDAFFMGTADEPVCHHHRPGSVCGQKRNHLFANFGVRPYVGVL